MDIECCLPPTQISTRANAKSCRQWGTAPCTSPPQGLISWKHEKMWGSQWTPCWTWDSRVPTAKKASHILGGISVASRSGAVVSPTVHHLRDCSGHHLGLLRTRFTGGRWGKVTRAAAQDTRAGRGCRTCTCSGEITLLSKPTWWHVHDTGATLFSEVRRERTRGSRHKLDHEKCQLNIRKKN